MILKRDIRIQFIMAPEELAAIDDFRFARRMPNRSAAVREVVSGVGQCEPQRPVKKIGLKLEQMRNFDVLRLLIKR